MPRSQNEIIKQIETQLRFLKKSAEAFDAGDTDEALRLATTVCTILEDGRRKNVKSVLSLAGVSDKIQFIASGRPLNPRNLVPESPLAIMRVWSSGEAKFLPRLDEPPSGGIRKLSLFEWWNEPIFRDGSKPMRIPVIADTDSV